MRYDIVFFTDGLKFSGNSLNKGQPLGGSETALLQLAKELAQRHEITVFCNCTEEGIFDGVTYLSNKKVAQWTRTGECDIFVAHRFMDIFKFPINAKLRILWNHDILVEPAPLLSLLYNIDYMYCLSDYHRQQYIREAKELASVVKIFSNGIDFSLIPKNIEKKHKIMFTSRHERGMFRALELYEKLGDRSLEFLACTYPSIGGEDIKQIERLCIDKIRDLNMKGFKVGLNSFPKRELYKNIAESKAVFYPTEFPEIFYLGGVEAQACGTMVVTFDRFAMKETIAYKGCKNSDKQILARLREVLEGDNKDMIREGREHVQKYNWRKIAEKFIDDADEHFEKRSQDREGIFDRLRYESDLIAARQYAYKHGLDAKQIEHDLRYVDGCEDIKDLYENEETFERIDLDPETFRKNGRFRWLSSRVKEYGIRTLMDFGCHCGWACLLVGNENPDCKITGYDISEKAIVIGRERQKIYDTNKNVEFTNREPTEEFDALFAGEYLEHTADPEAEIDRLEQFIKPGGKMFITIPKGAWEWLSRHDNKKLDVFYHVHGFEKRDIMTMFSKKKDFNCKVIDVGNGGCGENLGNYLIEYTVDGAPTERRDFDTKARLLRPFQTISACIIAKNAERDIENMLGSIVNEVDEIIVGIDKGTTDETAKRCEKYGAKIIELPQSICEPDWWGFGNARNHVTSFAKGRWILWIDTDERLIATDRIKKFLDGGVMNAFVIKQHHPELDSFIEADKPHRLYRAGAGKFYGYIHEQVQKDINQPLEPSLIMGQVNIIHFGAIHEAQRRVKSTDRNMFLLEKDMEKNPTRKLNKVLLMRDFLNRIKWAAEKFGTFQTKDALKLSLPAIKTLYERHFRKEKDPIYKDLADKVLQDAMMLMEDGFEVAYNFTISKFNTKGEVLDAKRIRLNPQDVDEFISKVGEQLRKAMEPRIL